MEKRILVIGATGLLGKPVAKHLQQNGYIVRIMVRDMHKASWQPGNNFEIVEGDVTHLNTIEKALDDCYGVHINLSGEIEQIGVENISSVASGLKLQRISYISGTSVAEENIGVPLIRRKFWAEKAVRESDVDYCIFCPTWFMEVLPKYVRGNRAFVFGKQPNPYHLVAADDYARMVAVSYGLEQAANKRFIVHGPQGLLFHEALRRYCNILHPEVEKISTMPYWVTTLIALIRNQKQMKIASDFMAAFEKIGVRGDPSEANNILGTPQIKLEDWLRQRKNIKFKKQ